MQIFFALRPLMFRCYIMATDGLHVPSVVLPHFFHLLFAYRASKAPKIRHHIPVARTFCVEADDMAVARTLMWKHRQTIYHLLQ